MILSHAFLLDPIAKAIVVAKVGRLITIKELIPKIKQSRLKALILHGALEKISASTKIILHIVAPIIFSLTEWRKREGKTRGKLRMKSYFGISYFAKCIFGILDLLKMIRKKRIILVLIYISKVSMFL